MKPVLMFILLACPIVAVVKYQARPVVDRQLNALRRQQVISDMNLKAWEMKEHGAGGAVPVVKRGDVTGERDE